MGSFATGRGRWTALGQFVFVFSLNNAKYEYLKHCVLLLYQYKIGKGDVVYRKLMLKLREQVDQSASARSIREISIKTWSILRVPLNHTHVSLCFLVHRTRSITNLLFSREIEETVETEKRWKKSSQNNRGHLP